MGDTFVTIPAWVAFGAITTAVKLKLILVKIMFALKTMGVGKEFAVKKIVLLKLKILIKC